MLQSSALALAAVVLAACSGSRSVLQPTNDVGHPAWDGSPVQTDSLNYRLVRTPGAFRAYARASYVNTTGAPVYFARCGSGSTTPMFSIRRTGPDSARKFFVDWAWACVGGVPTGTIQPGDSVSVRVPFGSVDQPTMQPPLEPEDLVGMFRIQLSLCATPATDSDFCQASPWSARTSNAFTIHY